MWLAAPDSQCLEQLGLALLRFVVGANSFLLPQPRHRPLQFFPIEQSDHGGQADTQVAAGFLPDALSQFIALSAAWETSSAVTLSSLPAQSCHSRDSPSAVIASRARGQWPGRRHRLLGSPGCRSYIGPSGAKVMWLYFSASPRLPR